jgi:hypothetical protein
MWIVDGGLWKLPDVTPFAIQRLYASRESAKKKVDC